MKKTVVILLSDKRSGSTMFERELCKHPEISHIDYCPHSYNETHHWLKAAVLLDLPASMFSGGRVFRGYGSKKNARTYLIDGIKGNVPEFVEPEDVKKLVFEGWEAMCHQFAKPVFFEKSPQHLAHWGALSLMLEWAEKTEFDVKFVGLVRNPLGVMYSAQQLFGTDPEKRQYGWAAIQRNLLAFKQLIDPNQYHQLRYENLINDPVGEFGKVFDFIGVERDEAVGAEVHAKSLDKAKDDPNFGLQLDESVKQMARRLGYSDEDIKNDTWLTNNPSVGPGFLMRFRLMLRNRFVKPVMLRLKSKGDHS